MGVFDLSPENLQLTRQMLEGGMPTPPPPQDLPHAAGMGVAQGMGEFAVRGLFGGAPPTLGGASPAPSKLGFAGGLLRNLVPDAVVGVGKNVVGGAADHLIDQQRGLVNRFLKR